MSGVPGQERGGAPVLLALGLCAGLALLNWHVLTQEIDVSPVVLADSEEAPFPAIDSPAPEAVAARPGQYPQTLARPLFRASRRPPDATAQAAPAASAQRRVARLPDGIALVGIMKESGRTERALIRSGDSPTGEWVEIGQTLNGWRLSRIEPGSVQFEADGQKQSLSLFPARQD
ncbi:MULTISPECIES: hypothetical protein [Rhodomicrobium]|uniref:hypothetical protein n=1 Tax=Rhodomicrobium TaxID=1068 RepID=UPI000B4C1EE1|nr:MULTISPECIES: hypothetical protein [Rhodomicrobium]